MNRKIEEQLKFILSSCETFAKNSALNHGDIDSYPFLVSIGSNVGVIKALVDKNDSILYNIIEKKMEWLSTWKDTSTENGRQYILLRDLLKEAEVETT